MWLSRELTPLQQKFARIVEKVETMRQSQNQSKQQIEDLFSALMQKAFRGRKYKTMGRKF